MLSASRLRILQGSVFLLIAGSFLACHKDPPEKPKPVVVKKSPAELKQLADSATEALEALKPVLAALGSKFTALHQEFDPLPPDLPEFGILRSKFYAADEGVGRMNAKIPWLSGKLAAAIKAGDAAELEEISKSVASSYEDVKQANQAALELLHEVKPFTKLAEEYQANKNAMCESTSNGTTAVNIEAAKKLLAH